MIRNNSPRLWKGVSISARVVSQCALMMSVSNDGAFSIRSGLVGVDVRLFHGCHESVRDYVYAPVVVLRMGDRSW